jgi:general secretion pathway protein D
MRPTLRLLQFGLLAAAAAGLAACESWLREEPRGPDREPPAPAALPAQPAAPTPLAQPAPPTEMAPLIERGSGRFVRPPPDRSRASIVRDAAGEVTLNVVDADLREVVRMVLGDTLGANYVIDPGVGGTITVQTSRPVRAEDLPAMLDAILRVNGAALIQVDDLFKVVPLDQALTGAPAPDIHPVPDAGRPGFSILVVPVRFVSAAELATLLEPFAPPGGSLQVDAERNMLLLAGTAQDLATLTDLVAMFDVDWLEGMSFGLFPLEFGRATSLVAELDQIFAVEEEGGPVSGVVRFVPIERLNAVLVMSSQPAYLDRAEAWIRRLDQAGEAGEPQVFVYSVQNGRAADLAQVLGEIFNVPSAAVGAEDLLAPGLEPAEISSSLLGREETLAEADLEPEEPRPPAAAPARRETQPPGRAPGRPLGRPPGRQPAPSEAPPPDIRIIADATTNSLVIWAAPREYRKIRRALDQLDILPLQVLIEATVAEVSLMDTLRYGVEWFLRSGDVSLALSQRGPGRFGPARLVAGRFPGFSALIAGTDVRVLLSALEEVTDVNVVSSPHLLVLDNQTARLQVGDQVPITVQSATAVTDPDAPIVNSIELRDTGVILSITPRVNVSGLVIMELEQEVSNVVQSETDTSSEQATPTISTRQISSTVAIQSGETVVLGGLIQDNQNRSVTGLPFLSRLPIVGALFGTRSRTGDRTELLVLLTPHVIRGADDARAITEELRRRLRSIAPLDQRMR